MPEPPKQSFFKGFFGGGAKVLDREELFGSSIASSTIAVKTEVAKMTAAQVTLGAACFNSYLCPTPASDFASTSATISASTPTYIHAPTSVALLPTYSSTQAQAAAGGSEIAKAKEAVCERGNKLNEVEEKTEQMSNEAKVILILNSLKFCICVISRSGPTHQET